MRTVSEITAELEQMDAGQVQEAISYLSKLCDNAREVKDQGCIDIFSDTIGRLNGRMRELQEQTTQEPGKVKIAAPEPSSQATDDSGEFIRCAKSDSEGKGCISKAGHKGFCKVRDIG